MANKVALERTAKLVKRSAVLRKGLAVFCGCLASVAAVTYTISYFYNHFGSFTVSIDRYDMVKQGLSLSEIPQFDKPISRLSAGAIKGMTNIAADSLPLDVDAINGDHNGDDHIAYTFYLKNTGEDTITYQYAIKLANVTQGVDAAIRVRLYVNGEPHTYAKTKSDGTGPELDTTEFLTQSTVMQEKKREFKPGDVDKFTVVIWLEGDDPDCTDDIIGGRLKTEMKFDIVESS